MKASTIFLACAIGGALCLFTNPSANAQSAPGITTQPSSQTAVAGANAAFSVVASGQTPLSYQWSRNGVNLVESAHLVGATNSALTIVSALVADAGSYTVVVTNRHGSVTSSTATLTVLVPPTISVIPSQRTFPNTATRPIAFTIGNAQSPTITVTSSDTNLVQPGGIMLSGAGTNWAITLMPTGALMGTTTMTVGVTNSGGLGASTSFLFSVTNFSEVATIFADVSRGTVNWVDYDNDGWLDLFVSGLDTNQMPHTSLYHKNGDGTFTEVTTPFANMQLASADWADFNNDGLPDLALNGVFTPWWDSQWSGTVIYRNDGNGQFTQVTNIGAFNEGTVRWGDYDNDGKMDVMITEADFNSLYHNNGDGTFTFVSTTMMGSGDNMAAWVDYDGDGKLDVFIAGETYPDSYGSRLYHNLGGGSFTNSGMSLTGFSSGGVVWADFNNDGTPDLVQTGTANGYAGSQIYRNDNGVLTSVASSLPGFQRSAAAAVGDFNNDGNMDLFLAGYDNNFVRVSQMFRGLGSMTFTGAQGSLLGLVNGYAAWGDYDGDGALDLVCIGETTNDVQTIKLYHNNGAMPDTPPTMPGGLTATLGYNSVVLAWNAATDAEQSGGLTYNVRVGTNANGVGVLSPLAELSTGFRRVPKFGNAGYRTSLLLTNLSGGTYFWSVQAIDNAFVGSTFAAEQSFTLPAPIIASQPNSLVVSNGTTASFGVALTGAAPLGYQWQLDGTNISGATGSGLVIASAALSDQGTYSVVVTNQFGSVTSTNVTLDVLTAPSFTLQPLSSTNLVGNWPSFSVSVIGTPPFAYQWFFNGAPLVNDRAFGTDSNVLTIASALTSDAGSYWVVVSNHYGTVTSDVVSLAVTAPDVLLNVDFGAGPSSLKTGPAAIGQTASDFWNSYGTNTTGVTNLFLADGTPSSVTVKVYGQGPVAPVNGNPDPMYHDYLYQYNLPGNLTVDTTNLPPGVFDFYYYAGCGDYNYQLYVNGVSQGQRQVWGSGDGSTNWLEGVHYAAFRGVTLTNFTSSVTVVITYLDSVCLEAVISGMQISEATTAPLFVLQPTNTAVVSGFDAQFTGGAVGSPLPISYQWLFNGAPLADNGHISGSTTYALHISAAQTNDIGAYQLVASTSAGSATSSAAMLWVQSLPPSFTLLPVGGVVAPGATLALSVKAVGSIPIGYQWYSNDVPLVDDGRIVGATSPNLTIAPAQTNDSANYYAVASNSVNVTTSSVANVYVGVAPTISQQPLSQTNIVGTIANFSASVDGTQPTYTWLFNGVRLSDSTHVSGSATTSLSISNVQVTDGGTYVLVASNGGGTVTSSGAVLTVLAPPTISPQPLGRSLPLGLPTTFSANATGPAPIAFQWQLNGTNISGATSTAYTISNVSAADLGTYNLVASNVAGLTVSSNALLTVGPVACWGRNNWNQCLPPAGLTNVTGLAGAANYSISVRSDGSLSSWGASFSLFPQSNAVAVSAGPSDAGHALLADGTVIDWGGGGVSSAFTNIVAIADGWNSSLFLRSDGTVTAIPSIYTPFGLTKITAIATGSGNQNLALRSDGTVLEWGTPITGGGISAITNPIPGLSNVVAIAAGYYQCLALKSDGRVVAWGSRGTAGNVPAILTNASAPGVVAIAAGGYPQGQSHDLALLTNGTVIAWGEDPFGETNVPSGLSNVVAVAAGAYHSLALVSDGRPVIVKSPVGGTAFTGREFKFTAQAVGNAPLVYQWTFNGTNITGATDANLTITNVQFSNAGTYQLTVSNSVGVASSVPLPVTVMNSAPFFNTQLTPQTAYVGTRFVWTAPVSGSGPVHIQWRIATNPPTLSLAWQDIPGATNEDFAINPVTGGEGGLYSVVASNVFGTATSTSATFTVRQVVGWGDSAYGKTNVPVTLTNAIAISDTGIFGTVALRSDGTPLSWGGFGTNAPVGVSNLCQVAMGSGSLLFGLRTNGTPVVWNGSATSGVSSLLTNALAKMSNIVSIEADNNGTSYLRVDGTVAALDNNGNVVNRPVGSNIIDVTPMSGGTAYNALRADGSLYWGGGIGLPVSATNIYSIASGIYYGVVLRRDETIQTIGNTNAPTSNVVAIAAIETGVKIAVRSDGTLTNWGAGSVGTTNTPAAVVKPMAIDGGQSSFVALLSTNDFPPMILPMALDTKEIVLSSRGSPQWFAQTRVTHDGQAAARSAVLGSNTASSMRTLVTNGPVVVSFWWKVSSETNHDFLTLSVGGVPQAAISGEVDWQQVTITVPAGPQMLVWTYSKDASGTAGLDAGFVDQLTFTPIAPTITSQPVSQTVLGGTAVSMSADVYGTAPLSYEWFEVGSSKPLRFGAVYSINPTARLNSGSYYVVVTNSVGSVTSSNAVLVVHVPQLIHTPIMQPDGTFVISSQDADGRYSYSTNASGFQAQYSSNLVDWWPVSAPLSLSNATLQFTDTDATNAPVRFYRVIEGW